MSAEKARAAIDSLNDHHAEEGITDETMQQVATIAIAEATLELAAQQRTANLIAYAYHRLEHPNAMQAKTGALGSLLGRADFEIREALGLHNIEGTD